MKTTRSFPFFDLFLLILLLSPIKSQLPVNTILFPSNCAGNDNNCPSYRYSRCASNNNQCSDCNNAGDCDHLTGGSGGDCRSLSSGGTYCYIPCSSGSSTCLSMRAICDTSSGSGYCNQCSWNSDCTSQGYTGTVYCDKTTKSGFGVCSSCPSTGCTVGTCQNFKCVQCTSNTGCSSPTPYCIQKFEGNFCKQCLANSDCTSNSALSKCDTSTNTCVICSAQSDCSLITGKQYCSSTLGCVQCLNDGHCSGATPYCSPTGTCSQCLASTNCASPTLPYCSSSYICTVCTSFTSVCSARYPSTLPYCATSGVNNGACVRCTLNSQCPAGTPLCSNSNTCVQCLANTQCSRTTPICSGSNTCSICTDSTVCSSLYSPSYPYCATSGTNTGACVRCTQNSHCSGTTPYCSSSNTCVACVGDSNCNAAAPYCSPVNSVCTACPDSTVCGAQYASTLPYCATSGVNSGACVRCTQNSHCSGATPYCSSSNTCVQCLADSYCPFTAPDCSASYSCIACTSSTICGTRFTGTQPYCALSGSNTGGCVRCTQNSHCSGSTPYCSSSNTCVACLTDSNCPLASAPICSGGACQSCISNPSICATRFSGLPVCYGGNCVECGIASDCPANYPICLSNNCVECSSSTDCSNSAKPYCSPSTNNCEGCSSSSFCSSKYPGSLPYCDMSTGACVQCLLDSDCSGATPFCSSTTKTCVQCLGDGDCPSISAPKCSASGTCQPCTAYTGICASKFTNQPVCSGGNCVGCGSASDCLDPAKPVCNTGAGSCVQCLSSSDCASPNAPYCSSETCQPCTNSPTAICPGKFPALPLCYSDQCVECVSDTDCSDPTKPNCMSMICQATVYLSQCLPQYNIQAYQTSDLSIFNINFPSDLVTKTPNLPSVLTLALINVPSTDYTYTLNKLSDTNYQAIFTYQATIPVTELKITLPCPYQHGYSFGDIQVTIPTQKVAFTTPEIQQTMKTIQGVATTATTVMAGASGSMMIVGANPAIMWALIGLLQTFYYMIFINVQYPANVQAFFGLFTMGNLSFIPNPMKWFFPNIDNESLDAPAKFLENDVDGLFLQGGGNELLTWFVVIMGYILSKLFLTYTRNMPRLLSGSAAKTVSMFEWSGVLRTLITSYTQLAMAAFLQIRVLNFNETLFSLSSVTGILFTVFAFTFPLAVYWLIKKYRRSVRMMKIKYSTLIEEYKYEPSASANEIVPQYFTVFFLVRRLVLCLTLVYSHNHPYMEIFLLITNCLIWLILLVKYRPYDTKVNNFVNIISEACFVGVHVLILLLIHGDYTGWLSDKNRLDIGWGIIGACGFILVMTLVASFVQQYYTMKKMIKLLMQVIEKSRKSKANRVKRMQSPTVHPIKSVSRSGSLVVSTVGTIEPGLSARELLENSSSFRGSELEPGVNNNYKIVKRISMGDNNYKLGRFIQRNNWN